MKNTIFLIAFMLFSTMSFAHFPVTKTVVEGNEVIEATISNSDAYGGKTQVATLLICFFLGYIGIHRFYLGDVWQGVVQLVTFGGLGVWTLIDFVRICVGDLGPGW